MSDCYPKEEVEYLAMPNNFQAEHSLLGGLMIDNSAFSKVMGLIAVDDFFDKYNQAVFLAITDLAAKKSPIDIVTVEELLKQSDKQRPSIGWFAYVGAMARDTPSSANIVAYAKIVRDYSVRRQGIKAFNEASKKLFDVKEKNIEGVFSGVATENSRLILALNPSVTGGVVHIKKILSDVIDNVQTLFESDGKNTGLVETGWIDFDKAWGGLPKGLVVIGGRPGMGKSTAGQNIVENFAIKESTKGKPVIFFTTEMTPEKLVMRMLSSVGRIDYTKISTGKLDDNDWPRLTAAINYLANSAIYIDGTNNLTTTAYQSKIEQFTRDIGKPELIVVDYLQRMDVPEMRNNRVGLVSEVSRVLTLSAKELQIPVIALAQLNRGLESRPDKRPNMADLRDSGQIEQDADLIGFVYRDEVYNDDSPDKGVAEFITGKARDNEVGTIRLVANLKQSRFENHSSMSYAESDYN
jgi:replicative DNA helicase